MLTTYIRKYIEKDESPQDSDGSICILDDIQKPVVYLEINKENIQNDQPVLIQRDGHVEVPDQMLQSVKSFSISSGDSIDDFLDVLGSVKADFFKDSHLEQGQLVDSEYQLVGLQKVLKKRVEIVDYLYV